MILVAIGANLASASGSPLDTCRAAAAEIAALPGLRLAGQSRWYASAPVPASDQPDYVNGVLAVQGAFTPEALLAALQAIEAEAGRVRGERNAPRVLDLDIIDLDGSVRDAPDPVLPHPRAHQRGFVLYPLRDVAPAWVHPRSGQSVDTLIALLPPERIRPLSD